MREFARRVLSAAEFGDMIELRLDCLEPLELESTWKELRDLVRGTGRPTITTLRPAEQGGLREIDFASRYVFWNLNHDAGSSDFIDLEMDLGLAFTSEKSPPPLPVEWERIICSHHDFVGVPSDLDQIYERMASTPARVLKVAVRADDVTDCLSVFHLLDRARRDGREMIAIAMGAAGIATRILGPSRGGFLTYGALESESATAPGQLTAKDLRGLYRIDEIGPQTGITGLIGFPVAHSISPQIQNASFAAAQVDACYIPFEVRDVIAFIRRMVHPGTREIDWNVRGLSVTAPHKTAVIGHLDWIEPSAIEIGAVNTIVVNDDALLGYNTDASAVLKPLIKKLGPLAGARCALIGAGGAARATLWSLRRAGVDTTLLVRDQHKGQALAAQFGASCETLGASSCREFDVVINATPLGTRGPLASETPVTAEQLLGARLAYDLVYNPGDTLFLQAARTAGCDTIGGFEMLVLQAAEQFSLWTGAEAPLDVVRAAAVCAARGW